MKLILTLFISTILFTSCGKSQKTLLKTPHSTQENKKDNFTGKKQTFSEARKSFSTVLIKKKSENKLSKESTNPEFLKVQYESKIGKMDGYVSRAPKVNKKSPAIIWVYGGFSNSVLGEDFKSDGDMLNDQSAMNFHKHGIVTFFPSVRGGNFNPGHHETFYGEVDDLISSYNFLTTLPYVDSERIYLAGHSTGGTLALLTAEATSKFRAVFSLGPVKSTALYGQEYCSFDVNDRNEVKMRAPIEWLDSISSPTFILEGSNGSSNIDDLQEMSIATENKSVSFLPIEGYDHFSCIFPLNELISQKILKDTSLKCNISFPAADLSKKLDQIVKSFTKPLQPQNDRKDNQQVVSVKNVKEKTVQIVEENIIIRQSIQNMQDLQTTHWNDIRKNQNSSAKDNIAITKTFIKNYVSELTKMHKVASPNDKKVIKLLRHFMTQWCKSDIIYIVNLRKNYDLLNLSFSGAGVRDAISTNDYALKEISKLDKLEEHFLLNFISSVNNNFRKASFENIDLKQYCVGLVKSFSRTIKKIKPVAKASTAVINDLYNINTTARNNIIDNKLQFKTQNDVNYFNKQIEGFRRNNKIFTEALNTYYNN